MEGGRGGNATPERNRPGAATRGQQQPAVGHKSSKERPTRQGKSSQHSAAAADGATGAGYPERGRERDRQKGKKGEARQANEGKCGRPAGRAVHAATNRGRTLPFFDLTCYTLRHYTWRVPKYLVRFIMASWQSRSKRQGSRVQGEPHRRLSFSLTQVPGGGSSPKERGSGENATHEGGWGVPHRQPATAHTAAGTQGSPPRGT